MIKKNKIIAFLLLIIVTMSKIFAAYDNTNIDLGTHRIKYNKNENRYIKYNGISQRFFDYYYLDNEGVRYPAYCINLGMDGAEKGEYDVNVNEKLQDKTLNNIILNGYPYKSPSELGLSTEDEAKFATQFAAWCYVSNLDFGKIEALNQEGIKVANAIRNIYEKGINTEILPNTVNIVEVSKEFKIDDKDEEYYSKKIKLEYNENVKEIVLRKNSLEAIITDLNNNKIDKITNQKEVKILIKRNKVLENIKFSLEFDTLVKENSVMFGASLDSSKQNTALALRLLKTNIIKMDNELKYIPTYLKIIKVDKDDNAIRLPNTKFSISLKSTGRLLGEYVTDENGEINLDISKDLKIFKSEELELKEIEASKGYYISKEENAYNIKVKMEKENTISISNDKIKGNIKILKLSNEDNKLSGLKKNTPLCDTVFNIYNENNELVDTITTDKNGVATSKDLEYGKYYIKEIKSSKYYVLNSNTFKAEITKMGEVINLTIGNDNVVYSEELPFTGM